MEKSSEKQNQQDMMNNLRNDCPVKDKDGNCLVPGTYSDSDEIGGG